MNSETTEQFIELYNQAYIFLKDKVGEKVLRKELDHFFDCQPKKLTDVFKQMANSLKNRQGFVNFIADVEKMKEVLCGFDPFKIIKKYDQDWLTLCQIFKSLYGSHYKFDLNNHRNAWVMYSKGILSCAKFLSSFKEFDDFDKFIRTFTDSNNEFIIAALPMLLEKEIYGFGFPLACDFLKELGYTEYGKPDVHLKDIFVEVGAVESSDDYEVFKKIVKIGALVHEKPVIVDKIFWLIGSGKFNENNLKIGSQKDEFVAQFKKVLAVNPDKK